jgi:hypothetical protein
MIFSLPSSQHRTTTAHNSHGVDNLVLHLPDQYTPQSQGFLKQTQAFFSYSNFFQQKKKTKDGR